MAEEKASKKSTGSTPSVACRDITGFKCDFKAVPDGNIENAGGFYSTQLITMMSKHMIAEHPGYALNKQLRDEIRKSVPY